jgi:hypothetical protein
MESNIKLPLNLLLILLRRPSHNNSSSRTTPQRRWGKVAKMHELFSKKNKDKSKISFTDMPFQA